ncbi:F-box/LRR-repeat protein 5, partial [Frankliniella fusca]
MELLGLPSEVLLMVLRYLDPLSVLACRAVCARLRDLALHPHVWRHRHLRSASRVEVVPFMMIPRTIPHSALRAALRLAPIVHRLHVALPACSAELRRLYSTTRCAAADLRLTVETKSGVLPAAYVIRNQNALGRLQELWVNVYTVMDVNDAPALFEAIVSTSGLVNLHIFETPYSRSSSPMYSTRAEARLSWPSRPSLRRFYCDLSPRWAPLCEAVLAAHAATLEVVELGHLVSATAASLLSRMPRLRWLECTLLPGLEAVAGCPLLRDVQLLVARGPGSDARAAAEFLRRATQLRRLYLEYRDEEAEARTHRDEDLLLALAASHRSRLEMLDLRLVPDELFLGIRPDTAPSLDTLKVYSDAQCAHEFLHKDAVQRLLAVNPSLRLLVYLPDYCLVDSPCHACAR